MKVEFAGYMMKNLARTNAVSYCKDSFTIKEIAITFSHYWGTHIKRETAMYCLILRIALAGLYLAYIAYVFLFPVRIGDFFRSKS